MWALPKERLFKYPPLYPPEKRAYLAEHEADGIDEIPESRIEDVGRGGDLTALALSVKGGHIGDDVGLLNVLADKGVVAPYDEGVALYFYNSVENIASLGLIEHDVVFSDLSVGAREDNGIAVRLEKRAHARAEGVGHIGTALGYDLLDGFRCLGHISHR